MRCKEKDDYLLDPEYVYLLLGSCPIISLYFATGRRSISTSAASTEASVAYDLYLVDPIMCVLYQPVIDNDSPHGRGHM